MPPLRGFKRITLLRFYQNITATRFWLIGRNLSYLAKLLLQAMD
jgi:hypothetical protein